MPSESTLRTQMIRDHQEWLGYLQPDGLVVSPVALVDAQVVLDRRGLETQQRFLPCVQTIARDDDEVQAITDFPALCLGFLNWPADLLWGLDAERPMPDELSVPLPELGETLAPTFALRAYQPADAHPPWLLLVKVLEPGADMDAATTGPDALWSASASRRFERLLRETRVPVGLLSNGTHIRLMVAPRGENTGSLTFPVYAMAEVAGRPIVSAFHELLSAYRLLAAPDGARLPALLRRSREYQSSVSIALAQQVLAALYELLRGFQSANEHARGELLRELLATAPDGVYHGLLTVLMRLVFLLYAEDRSVMPGTSLYQQHYSVHGLFERLRGDAERYPDTMDHRYGAWAQLLALFRAVYGGCKHQALQMPARRGYLFDPDRFPFLEGRTSPPAPLLGEEARHLPLIADGVIFRVLDKLLMLDGERLSYRTLDVEQIGSVYEAIMGFRLRTAGGPSIAIKPKKPHGAPAPIDLDDLLRQPAGDRVKWLKAQTDQDVSGESAAALKAARSIDEALAALERRIARAATPNVVPTGAMLLVPSDERRRSGSHYTPRALTEPIVRKALEPILKRLGEDALPDQILDLKMCDPAMGSGAFLVETCRQLAEALVKSWHRHKRLPDLPPDEDELLYARRLIAQRCLYGVDKNPMAVDLAKLSLWLATLARDHAFTFLDHALRAGDSLVGLTRRQIECLHWQDTQQELLQHVISNRVAEATQRRVLILDAGDALSPEGKRAKLDEADAMLNGVRRAGDLTIAAFFAAGDNRQREAIRKTLIDPVTAYLALPSPSPFQGEGGVRMDALARELRGGPFPITPFHWEIEFPEVFDREKPGFDAIVGNPPFAGKNTLINSNREGYVDWLKALHAESHGNADLVAHFFRQAYHLLRQDGCFGLIATNTIGQGDTRATGLRWICTHGGTIYAARKRYKWPGQAAVVVSVVHVAKGNPPGPYDLDGRAVPIITAYLFHAGGHENPEILRANAGCSFQGTIVLGMGFTFDDTDASGVASSLADMQKLIITNPNNQSRIKPFISGEDVNDSPTQNPIRYVIDFEMMSEQEARAGWSELFDIVEKRVKPERLTQKDQGGRDKWWQFLRTRPELKEAIRPFARVLVVPIVSKHLSFILLPTSMVFANKLTVLALNQLSAFCVLSSLTHELWARFFSSTLEDRLNYTNTDCFETFPFPPNWVTNAMLEQAGHEYYEFRAALMVRNNEGLTKTYNRFHDPGETSPDILRLRELHAAMDRVVLDAYGWTDIPTECEFLLDYEDEDDDEDGSDAGGRKRRKPWRYRWPDVVRDEVLARLLALNAQRAEEERLAEAAAATAAVAEGKAEYKVKGKKRGRQAKKPEPGNAPPNGLFDP